MSGDLHARADDAFVSLAALMERGDLASLLADVLIAVALKRDDEPTPHEVARHAAGSFGWSEETWREVVRPHILARLDRPSSDGTADSGATEENT